MQATKMIFELFFAVSISNFKSTTCLLQIIPLLLEPFNNRLSIYIQNSWFGLVESENILISAFTTLNFLLYSSE